MCQLVGQWRGLGVRWFYFRCLLTWQISGNRESPLWCRCSGRRKPRALWWLRGCLQDVKREIKKRFGNTRLGEWDWWEEANNVEILTIFELLSSVGLKRHMLTLLSTLYSRKSATPSALDCLGQALETEQRQFLLLLTYAVIAKATMRGTRGPENLAGETVFKFHSLAIDDDFFGSGRWAVPP